MIRVSNTSAIGAIGQPRLHRHHRHRHAVAAVLRRRHFFLDSATRRFTASVLRPELRAALLQQQWPDHLQAGQRRFSNQRPVVVPFHSTHSHRLGSISLSTSTLTSAVYYQVQGSKLIIEWSNVSSTSDPRHPDQLRSGPRLVGQQHPVQLRQPGERDSDPDNGLSAYRRHQGRQRAPRAVPISWTSTPGPTPSWTRTSSILIQQPSSTSRLLRASTSTPGSHRPSRSRGSARGQRQPCTMPPAICWPWARSGRGVDERHLQLCGSGQRHLLRKVPGVRRTRSMTWS